MVKTPPELQSAMESFPVALHYFNGLSYSHKKEYVIWILSSKQEKTRLERIARTVEKLLQGKKNPAVK